MSMNSMSVIIKRNPAIDLLASLCMFKDIEDTANEQEESTTERKQNQRNRKIVKKYAGNPNAKSSDVPEKISFTTLLNPNEIPKMELQLCLHPTCWVKIKKENVDEMKGSRKKVRFCKVQTEKSLRNNRKPHFNKSHEKERTLPSILKRNNDIKSRFSVARRQNDTELNQKLNTKTKDASIETHLSRKRKLSIHKLHRIDMISKDSPLGRLKNLQSIINEKTFLILPPKCQADLIKLLPPTDRIRLSSHLDSDKNSDEIRPRDSNLNNRTYNDNVLSALNNEFLSKAGVDWLKKLRTGEFTPLGKRQKKREKLRKQNCIDPWKVKNFEPIWGIKNLRNMKIGEPKLSNSIDICPKSNSDHVFNHKESNSIPGDTITNSKNDQIRSKSMKATDSNFERSCEKVSLNCLCHKPYISDQKIIGCDFCNGWYHESCLKLSRNDIKLIDNNKWACSKCFLISSASECADHSSEEIIIELIQGMISDILMY